MTTDDSHLANQTGPLRPPGTSPKSDEPQSYLGEAGWGSNRNDFLIAQTGVFLYAYIGNKWAQISQIKLEKLLTLGGG